MGPIRTLEEAADRAWPAREARHDDDWVARFSDGMHHRLNSATVWAAPDLDGALAEIAAWYATRGRPPLYRLTAASEPRLDPLLEHRGYRNGPGVAVMTRSLASAPAAPSGVSVSGLPPEGWRDAFAAMSGYGPQRRRLLEGILGRITGATGFAVAGAGDDPAGGGMAVVDRRWAGLFEIVVHPSRRGAGHGSRVVAALLAWSRQQGARTAYLQVFEENLPALALYRSAGFTAHHRYWYREPPGGLPPGPR